MSIDPWVRGLWGASVVFVMGCGSLLPYPDDAEYPPVAAPPGEGQPNSYQCKCTCADEVKTIEYAMVSGLDDAEERKSNGVVSIGDGTLDLVTASNGASQLVGLAFEGAIPLGAEIVSARVLFTAQSATSGPASFTIRAQHAAEVVPFTATSRNVSDRALAGATVNWSDVPAWGAAGDHGEAQRTPELKPIFDDLASSVSWNGRTIVLVFDGSGRRAAWSFDGNPGSAPVLTVQFRPNRSAVFPLSVCMPDGLNPNRAGNDAPTDAELAADCAGRVTNTVNGLAEACGYPTCSCEIAPHPTDPAKIAPPRFASACNEACEPEAVTDTCGNFAPTVTTPTATHAGDDTPVCVTHSPLASALYGQRSQCELQGEALIEIEDEDEQRGARGTMMLVGRPCPGASCSVGVELGLDVDDVQFDTLFAEANFVQLSMVGKTVAGGSLALSAAGAGSLSRGLVESSNHGTRLPEDDDEDAETVAYTQRNTTALPVTVDWTGNACTLDGELALNGNVKVSLTGLADVTETITGTIVNQPPAADAGDDQLDVECNVQGGARIVLDGGGSTDPDGAGDLASIRWFAGSRSGPAVGYALKTVVAQTGLGTNGTWVLRVVDGGGQSDEDSVTTKVIDTTAPSVVCNTPATIAPPDAQHPAVFTASATDTCSGPLIPTLSNPSCYFFTKSGKRVFRDQCEVTLNGPTISISNSGGVGDLISWDAAVTDSSGNAASTTCTVQVVRPL